MSNQQSDLVELCALWKGETKGGKKCLSGRMGNAKVFIFYTTDKQNERAPDARIMVAPFRDENRGGQGQGDRQGGAQGRSGGGYNNNAGQTSNRSTGDDDIPF